MIFLVDWVMLLKYLYTCVCIYIYIYVHLGPKGCANRDEQTSNYFNVEQLRNKLGVEHQPVMSFHL